MVLLDSNRSHQEELFSHDIVHEEPLTGQIDLFPNNHDISKVIKHQSQTTAQLVSTRNIQEYTPIQEEIIFDEQSVVENFLNELRKKYQYVEDVELRDELIKKEIIASIIENPMIFKDVDKKDIKMWIIEIGNQSSCTSTFTSCWHEFNVTNYWKKSVYFIDGYTFNLSELWKKTWCFVLLIADAGLSNKWKIIDKSQLNKEWEPMDYLSEFSTYWCEVKFSDVKYLNVDKFITNDSAIIHLMVKWGDKYKVELKYNISIDPRDSSNWKNVTEVNLVSIKKSHNGRFVDEWRKTQEYKKNLKTLCIAILNSGSFNPYVRSDDE